MPERENTPGDLLFPPFFRTVSGYRSFMQGRFPVPYEQYARYAKWAALALFLLVAMGAASWGVGGAIAAFLALALFAVLYAKDEIAVHPVTTDEPEKEEPKKKEKPTPQPEEPVRVSSVPGALPATGNSIELKSMLFDRAGEEKKLLEAARSGDLALVTQLVEQGTALDAENHNGVTPLMFAVRGGHAPVVTYLIEQGADVNKKTKNGVTPMRIARDAKAQEMMDLLAAGGALD